MADPTPTPAAPADGKPGPSSTPAANPPAPGTSTPEDPKAKAARLAAGNPHEFEAAMANATPTEKAALTAAKAEYDAANAPAKPFTLAGVPGGAFSVDGPGLGTGGTLTLNGVVVPTTRWDDRSIRGTLPADAKPGQVQLQLAGGKTLSGTYGPPQPKK